MYVVYAHQIMSDRWPLQRYGPKDLGVSKTRRGVSSWMCNNKARNTINLSIMPDNGLTLLDNMLEKQLALN